MGNSGKDHVRRKLTDVRELSGPGRADKPFLGFVDGMRIVKMTP